MGWDLPADVRGQREPGLVKERQEACEAGMRQLGQLARNSGTAQSPNQLDAGDPTAFGLRDQKREVAPN